MLAPCRAVHTAGMRFSLDLVFFDGDGRVVRAVRGLRPWRLARGGRAAWGVLELEAGWFPWTRLEQDGRLAFHPLPSAGGLPENAFIRPPAP